MKKINCVVFGGGGFIGSHLVEKLVEKKYNVVVFNHDSEQAFKNLSSVIDKIQFVSGDINNINLIKKTVNSETLVFDLVASSVPFSSMKLPLKEIEKHIYTHVQFIQTVCERKAKKIIFISSGGGVYGDKSKLPVSEDEFLQPISPHAIGKATTEYYLDYFSRIYDVPYIIYRVSNPYGPRQMSQSGFGIVPTLFSHVLHNTPPTLFHKGSLIRDFIYIDDVIDAILASFDIKTKYRIYNIGSGKGISLNSLWREIKRITRSKLNPIYGSKRPIDANSIILNTDRFKQEFNWRSEVGLKEGLATTWKDSKK